MRHTQALRQFIILASHYLCLLLIPLRPANDARADIRGYFSVRLFHM